jgi:hypothetical protein
LNALLPFDGGEFGQGGAGAFEPAQKRRADDEDRRRGGEPEQQGNHNGEHGPSLRFGDSFCC